MLVLACLAVSVRASRKDEITLIMVPRTKPMVRLGMDLANKYPSLFISYALGANGAVSLHGWTGSKWVNISPTDFAAGTFFKKAPDSVLIIESQKVPVPEILIPPEDWCQNVAKITTTQLRPLIHLTGQYFDFDYKDWKWFADRYKMDMDAINPEGLNVKWYNKRLVDHFGEDKAIGESDLQYWVMLRQAVLADPELVPEVDETAPDAAPDAVAAEEELDNPFAHEVPPAEILGAPDAEEGEE